MPQTRMLNPHPLSPLRYLAYLLLLLPFFIFRDYTPPNELKYLSIVEDALRNGTWFTFYNHGEIYADKPPLFFWLMMASKMLTGGHHMWILGLFSLLPAIGTLALMDKWLRKTSTAHYPAASNLMLLTTAMFTGAAMIVRMDMLMTFFITLSLYTFYRIYEGSAGPAAKYMLPVYIFLSIFSKGPMGFLIPVACIIVFLLVRGRITTIGRYLGWRQWAILLSLCAVWFSLIYLEGGNEYLHNLLFKQTVGRGIDSFHHKEPVWFYFPNMLWSFAPWTLLYIVLICKGIGRRMIGSEVQKFFTVTICTIIVMLSLISSKLDIYLLPVYPFVVYLCASLLPGNEKSAWVKLSLGIPAAVCALALPAFFAARSYIPYDFTGILPYIGTGVLTIGGITALIMLLRNRTANAILSMGWAMLAMVFVLAFSVPQFNRYYGFSELAETAKAEAQSRQIDHYAFYRFYTAENMDVFLGQKLEEIQTTEQIDSLERLPHRTILFFRAKEIRRDDVLKQWASSHRPGRVTGEYSWYVLGGGECDDCPENAPENDPTDQTTNPATTATINSSTTTTTEARRSAATVATTTTEKEQR